MRHVYCFLTIYSIDYLWRGANFISHYVIDKICTDTSTEAHIRNLDRRRSKDKHIIPFAGCPSIQIKEHMNVFAIDHLSKVHSAHILIDFIELIAALLNFLSPLTPIIFPQA